MNFFQLSEKRESCRSYSDKSVDNEVIKDILKAASNTASACNSQPWKFIVCTDDTAKEMPNCIIHPDFKINGWVEEVPVFIVVCETKARLFKGAPVDSQHYAQLDIGNAVGTICYAATDIGLSTCIIGMFDEQKIKTLLNIPNDITVRLIVTLGYSKTEEVRTKSRKQLDDIVSFNSF